MKSSSFFILSAVLASSSYSLAFTLVSQHVGAKYQHSVLSSSSMPLDETFTNPVEMIKQSLITEEACIDAAMKMKRVNVPVSSSISDDCEVGISYIHWEPTTKPKKPTLPVILVHGFDSSSLEYRRLGPLLAEQGIDTYAVDILGWGFTRLDNVKSFSAQAKVEALTSFWSTIGCERDVCLVGASLGGAAAIEYAATKDHVKACVMIDAQGFVDGTGPMAKLPKFLANAGVQILKTEALRSAANQMSYYDKETYATNDALKIGRLHCLQDKWSDALVSFMLSGGFAPSQKVPMINVPSLILWGRQDTILDIEFAEKFVNAIPDAELKWIDECGHVPHLEQPYKTASTIAEFLSSDKFDNLRADSEIISIATPFNPILIGGLSAAAFGTAIFSSF